MKIIYFFLLSLLFNTEVTVVHVSGLPCPEVPEGGCSICGPDLCVTEIDALFEFPGQPVVPCGILEETGLLGLLPEEGCNFLPSLVKDLCGCQSTRPDVPTPVPTIASTTTPEILPAPAQLREPCPEVPDGGCSICGPDLCVTNNDAMFTFPGQPVVRCDILEQSGLKGELPEAGCNFLPSLVKDDCACDTSRPVAPTNPPTDSPTKSPTTTPISSGNFVGGNYIAEIFPDPHFRTWHNYHYSYHGACDMIFMTNDLIDLHVRTENSKKNKKGFWSTPSSAAIRVGADIVEVTQDNDIFYNFDKIATPLNIVRETHHIWEGSNGIVVFLSGGHFIFIQALDFSSSELRGVTVRASIPGPGFSGVESTPYPLTTGMSGTWGKFGLVGRNGKVFNNVDKFAKDWEVRSDDPQILRPGDDTSSCMDRPVVLPDKAENDLTMAEQECSNVLEEYRPECLFDAWVTKGSSVAENPIYNFALDTFQEPRCSATNITCHYLGGHCMVGCDKSKTNCYPDLCGETGDLNKIGVELQIPSGGDIVSGCSCMVEFEPATYPPSPSPSAVPSISFLPTKTKEPSANPTTLPSTTPSSNPTSTTMPSFSPTTSPTDSPAPTVTAVPSGAPVEVGLCFSGSNLIRIKKDDEIKTIKMKDLRLGDYILARNGQYEKVYSYGHFEPDKKAEYLEINSSGSHHPLEITEDHMIIVLSGQAVPASNLRVGDQIISGDGSPKVIESIRRVIRMGLYAPLTQSGTVVVNDVLASCYMAYESSDSMDLIANYKMPYQFTCHLFFAPLRMWCKLSSRCDSQTFAVNGMSHWTDLPFKMSLWLHQQGEIIKSILVAVYLAIYIPLGILEFIIDSYLYLVILLATFSIFYMKPSNKNKVELKAVTVKGVINIRQ